MPLAAFVCATYLVNDPSDGRLLVHDVREEINEKSLPHTEFIEFFSEFDGSTGVPFKAVALVLFDGPSSSINALAGSFGVRGVLRIEDIAQQPRSFVEGNRRTIEEWLANRQVFVALQTALDMREAAERIALALNPRWQEFPAWWNPSAPPG
jgi:hypothetical protein